MINCIDDYRDTYVFTDSLVKEMTNISAFQMELPIENMDMGKSIIYFIEQLQLDFKNFYLLLYKSIGDYNKVHEYKKLWRSYPITDHMRKGKEISYVFSEGIVFASGAHIDELNLKDGLDIVTQNMLNSAMIYSDVDITENDNLHEIFDEMFHSQIKCINNPEVIQMDFPYLMKKICKGNNGVLRYANDGEEAEIAFFVKKNT